MTIPVEIADDATELLARHGHPDARVFDVDSEVSPTVIVFTEGKVAKTPLVTVTKGKTKVDVQRGWDV